LQPSPDNARNDEHDTEQADDEKPFHGSYPLCAADDAIESNIGQSRAPTQPLQTLSLGGLPAQRVLRGTLLSMAGKAFR
jgi:hypothetical protein